MSSPLTYEFCPPDHPTIRFEFELNDGQYKLIANDQTPPPWAELGFQQCHHCPYQDNSSPRHCPAAVQLAKVLKAIDHLVSYDAVDVIVKSEQRTVTQASSAQEAISSLLGLVLASSGCPHTEFLRPMARFHLPMASADETLWRACSSYMLAQYFRQKNGEHPEGLEGLLRRYEHLEVLNTYLAKRLRSQVDQDACLNAITLLDSYAKRLPHYIKHAVEELKPLYQSYLMT